MLTIYSEAQTLHAGGRELSDGELVPCYECPERAALVRAAVASGGIGEIVEPEPFGRDPLLRVHDPRFVDFLETAWDEWQAAGRGGDALPFSWAGRGMRGIEPEHIDGRLGHFAFDVSTPVVAGTWTAASAAADVALTGAKRLAGGEQRVFSLCRPPGHHAGYDFYGGYCFLNNAAIAAQYLVDGGAARVAILDVDYHHGNGTQAIFYDRADVLFASIHADPRQEYPYFLGYADETGAGAGEGFNANFPLPWQSPARDWFAALDAALGRVRQFAPEALVVSLGVDTFAADPISQFRLETADYLEVGARIAATELPLLLVLEGGYATNDLGANVVNVLRGASREHD
ncbi:MAG: histone deacetylase family protein [Woeseiaceae bacterium]|nr:histone deacetylase family protein [Woeseiaceae bacterium]